MNNYKEYKLADKVRAEIKREKCPCVERITLYSMCNICGQHSMTVLKGEECKKSIIPCDLLCKCKVRTTAY
jgi:hypothetical protein